MDDVFNRSVMTGSLVRRIVDRTLGDLGTEEVFGMATEVAIDPGSASAITGVSPSRIGQVDPEGLRDSIMAEYENQRASDDLSRALADVSDSRDRIVNARRNAIYRCAGADESQMARAEFDRANGDMSYVNRAREMFFFE